MGTFATMPRFRIYTSSRDYISIITNMISGKIDKSDDCRKFEKTICHCLNIRHAKCTPQGRVAVFLAIKAIINPGQQVILSPYTIADVINMVICAGGVPVFADIQRETCNIDPDEIEKLIDRTTGAVMVTHLHGLLCPMERIVDICKKYDIPLIEDACQAFGTKLNGRAAGSFGDVGVYSFGMYKNVTAFYGGMVATNNSNIYKMIVDDIADMPYCELKWLLKKIISGLASDIATYPPLFRAIVYHIFRFGYLNNIRFINRFVETELDLSAKDEIPENYLRKMMPMQASLALSGLDRLEGDSEKRIRYAKLYHGGLCDLKGLILPPLRTDGSHIYTYFPIQFSDRQALVTWMMKNRCDVGIQHLKNTADLPAFKNHFRDCPNARATANEVILLPTYPRYSEMMVRRNIMVIRQFLKQSRMTSLGDNRQ